MDLENEHVKMNGATKEENSSLCKMEIIGGSKASEMDLEGGDRPQWSSQMDFIFSVVGWAIGLGNVWRFPYLCYKNGGGAFLIPYLIAIICGGVPIFCLEVALGQYMSQGGLNAWNLCPLFKGIGVAATVVLFILNIYYIIVLAWAVNYGVYAFQWTLPWSHCNNTWNTHRCRVSIGVNRTLLGEDSLNDYNESIIHSIESSSWTLVGDSSDSLSFNTTNSSITAAAAAVSNLSFVDPVVEFWEKKILHISNGIDEPGGIVGELALSLLFVWIVCYFCVWKGVKWTGKVVYFTATFPYLVITILLIRGVTLEGALTGIIFYLKPDFSKLTHSQVWIDAGTQIFFSYAIATGAMTSLGSYNRFKNNFYKDCIMISCINSCTSLYAGLAIFSVLGFMAHQQGVPIDQVAESGPGLAFIAYPKAVTQMYGSPFWAVLFFLMLFSLGLGSQFVGMEAFVTVCTDIFPKLGKPRWKESFVALYCAVSFLLGLSMVTEGGMYVFQLLDYYGASGMCLLWICFFQSIVIAWVYGVDRFYDNIQQMIGYRINPWLKFCWRFLTPLVSVGIFLFMWVKFEPLTYNRVYIYPVWAQTLGIIIALSSMVCIPVFIIFKFSTTRGSSLTEKWRRLTTPLLKPQRIPAHWPDHKELTLIGQNHYVRRR